MSRTLRLIFSSPCAVIAAVAVAGCGGGNDSPTKLALVAYSTTQEAHSELIQAFQSTAAGDDVTFSQFYGASGDQSRAVASGLAADVVEFSYAPDMERLVGAGNVAKDWDANDTNGIVTHSVVVFAVREGNPNHIKTWDDLTKPGVEVITANPIVSGGGRWNLVAAYGQALKFGDTPTEALAYVKSLLANVSVQDRSGREALQTFAGGKGDVLLTYESEAIAARAKGQELEYVIPPTTLLIENPIAVTTSTENSAAAEGFVAYLKSDPGQKIFAANGFRPVNPDLVDKKVYPIPETLLTVNELGGWTKVDKQLFDDEDGELTRINQDLGMAVK